MALFEYPVMITVAELKNERDLDITKEYSVYERTAFMADVHSAIYEGAIYATGDKDIKDRIINTHKTKMETAIKRALILQATSMHDEGNVGTSSGITATADGQKSGVGKMELRSKRVCLAAFDALKACPYSILYAGEDL